MRQVLNLIADASRLSAPLKVQIGVVAKLAELAKRLEDDDEFGSRAKEVFTPVSGVAVWEAHLAARLKRLNEELERQRRLAAERLAFAAKLDVFADTVAEAEEVTHFPLPSMDSLETLSSLLKTGSVQADDLLPAPEGADDESRAKASALLDAWRALQPDLAQRSAEAEGSKRAGMQVAKLNEQYADTSERFNAWYDRCDKLLALDPKAETVSPADVEKAVELATAQSAEVRIPQTIPIASIPSNIIPSHPSNPIVYPLPPIPSYPILIIPFPSHLI